MRSPTKIKRVYTCKWCKEGSGLILPEHLHKAIRMPDGSLKCWTCQVEELQTKIVKNAPDSDRAKEIRYLDKKTTDHHNQGADRLNQYANVELIKKRGYKFN